MTHRVIAVSLAVILLIAVAAPGAQAGGSSTTANIALGLASFAVFNQVVGPWWYPRAVYGWYGPAVYAPPVYYAAPVYYPAPVYYYARPAPAVVAPAPSAPAAGPTVVQYPHGRYELRGDGVRTAYQWVWIPNPPPAPAPPPAAPQ